MIAQARQLVKPAQYLVSLVTAEVRAHLLVVLTISFLDHLRHALPGAQLESQRGLGSLMTVLARSQVKHAQRLVELATTAPHNITLVTLTAGSLALPLNAPPSSAP